MKYFITIWVMENERKVLFLQSEKNLISNKGRKFEMKEEVKFQEKATESESGRKIRIFSGINSTNRYKVYFDLSANQF